MAGNSNNRKWWIAIVIGIVVAIAMANQPEHHHWWRWRERIGRLRDGLREPRAYAENDHDTFIRNCEQGVRDLQKAEEQGS